MDRRDFLKRGTLGVAAGATLAGCPGGERKVHELISRLETPAEITPGVATWYATTCRSCPAGCGAIVRVIDGRAKKVEGNPLHPVSQGGLCGRGQAAVQALYHPDRIRGPGSRPTPGAPLAPIAWDAAMARLSGALAKSEGKIALLSGALPGHLAVIARRLMASLGAPGPIVWEPFEPAGVRWGERAAYPGWRGAERATAEATLVLSFGADLLGAGEDPVAGARALGDLRRARTGTRGRLIHIGPRLSLTAANADEWLPVRPGTEGLLAWALTRSLQGHAPPADVAEACGLPPVRIERLLVSLRAAKRPLAIGGGSAAASTCGARAMAAVGALNRALGAINRRGGIREAPPERVRGGGGPPSAAGFRGVTELVARMDDGKVEVLLLHDTDPIHSVPTAVGFEEAMAKVPLVVSFASAPDDTTARAHLVLPDHVGLEAWGDHALAGGGWGLQQPAVVPRFDTRAFGDVLLQAARAVGGPAAEALPEASVRKTLEAAAPQIAPGRHWEDLLGAGGAFDRPESEGPPAPPGEPLPIAEPRPAYAGDASEFPLHLLPYPSPTLRDGRLGHLPWLQEAPDPITGARWGTVVELNPSTAARLGIRQGDLVRVRSGHQALEAPAHLHPGLHPEVVAIAAGRGRWEAGRHGSGVGENPLALLAHIVDEDTGALALAATRVAVERIRSAEEGT